MGQYSPQPHVFMAPPVIEDHTAAYYIKETCYLDDTIYNEGDYVYWPDTPNLAMSPVNAKAHETMKAYLEHLDECGREVEKRTGKKYYSQADALENARELENQNYRGRIQSHEIPLMSEKKTSRKSHKIDTVPQSAPMMTGGRKIVNKVGDSKKMGDGA